MFAVLPFVMALLGVFLVASPRAVLSEVKPAALSVEDVVGLMRRCAALSRIEDPIAQRVCQDAFVELEIHGLESGEFDKVLPTDGAVRELLECGIEHYGDRRYLKSFECYHRAASPPYEHPFAMARVGNMYLVGHGVEQNRDLGGQWITRAACARDAGAMYRLSYLIRIGVVPVKDAGC